LDYEGETNFIRSFPEIDKIDDYGKFMEIRLKEGTDSQVLLQKLVGKITINKYEVREPTLNAIFIEKVGDKDEKNLISH